MTYGKVSLCLWKSLGNSGNFFLLLSGHPVYVSSSSIPDGQVFAIRIIDNFTFSSIDIAASLPSC